MGRRGGQLVRLAVVACATAGCAIGDGDYFGRIPEPDPRHFRWCNSGEPEFIDPALATATNDIKIAEELFDGLTQHDPAGLPLPSMAESWDVSPDQRVFTFHLRPNLSWSNGRPITADDFVYSITRVLHPLTASRNAETLWRLANGKAYNSGTARVLLVDSPPFRAGDVVDTLPPKEGEPSGDPNERIARQTLRLRADPAPDAEAYATVPSGAKITIVELDPSRTWAYVFHGVGEGVYGWAPLADMDAPWDETDFSVVALGKPGDERKGTVKGKHLLMLPEIVGIRAPDPRTVVMTTEGPLPYLIDLTLQRVFRPAPREAVSRWPFTWTRPDKIVTSGGFHLVYWRQRDKFEFVKSPTYWDRERVRLDRVTVYTVDDQATSANLYYQGACDAVVANNVPSTFLPLLSGEAGPTGKPKLDYTRSAFNGNYFYLINVRRFPNVHLRRALVHALDRTQVPKILKGGQIATEQFTPGQRISDMSDADLALCGVTRDTPGVAMIVEKGKLCYVPPMGPRFDLKAAREELALARKELGDKFPQKITVRFNMGAEAHKYIAEWIQNEWRTKLGLEVETESQEWKVFLKDTATGEYDIARMGGIGNMPDPEAEFLSGFRCDNPDNRTGWCNKEFDRLYLEAEAEPERKRRLELIRRGEELMIADAPVIPLYVYTQHHLQKPYVRGLAINLIDHPMLRNVWIDPDWKEHR